MPTPGPVPVPRGARAPAEGERRAVPELGSHPLVEAIAGVRAVGRGTRRGPSRVAGMRPGAGVPLGHRRLVAPGHRMVAVEAVDRRCLGPRRCHGVWRGRQGRARGAVAVVTPGARDRPWLEAGRAAGGGREPCRPSVVGVAPRSALESSRLAVGAGAGWLGRERGTLASGNGRAPTVRTERRCLRPTLGSPTNG